MSARPPSMKRLPLYFPLSDGRARGLPKRPTTDERTDLVLVKSDRCQAVQSPTPGTEVSKACVDCISVVLFCRWMAALILAISLSSHRICASKERLIGSSRQCSRGFLSRCLSWPHGSRRLSQWPNGSCSGDQRGSSACICIAVAYSWISLASILSVFAQSPLH